MSTIRKPGGAGVFGADHLESARMQLEERSTGGVVIVKVSGEITLKKNRNTMLHDKVRGLMQQGHKRVLIDLAEVSYVDSAGLGELVQASSTAKNLGGSIKLFSPTSRLRELMVVTRLTSILGVYDDEAQALASYGPQEN
jgi:anti-sigma B factor antagonist